MGARVHSCSGTHLCSSLHSSGKHTVVNFHGDSEVTVFGKVMVSKNAQKSMHGTIDLCQPHYLQQHVDNLV